MLNVHRNVPGVLRDINRIVSDEIYHGLSYVEPCRSMVEYDPTAMVISSFSKYFCMTGWRVGYVVAPPDVARQIALHQEPVVSCASAISQHAALAALRGPQDGVAMMVDAYRARRDAAIAELDAAGVPSVRPGGSFFLMADVGAAGIGSWDLAGRLLQDAGLAKVSPESLGIKR